MNLSRFKPQNPEIVKRNQPDLYATLKKVFPNASDEDFGRIAGVVIEYVIQSKGNVDVFGEEDLLFDEEF